jgi:hypothetical protein
MSDGNESDSSIGTEELNELITEMEQYFREELKTWSYDLVKQEFYNKYNCFGFLMKNYREDSNSFCYTYDFEEYKSCCPNCYTFTLNPAFLRRFVALEFESDNDDERI